MHWCVVTKLGVCLRHHALKVLGKLWAIIISFKEKNCINFWIVLPTSLRLCWERWSNYTIIGRTSCPPFQFLRKHFFVLLYHWSDFHQILLESSSGYAGKFVSIDRTIFIYRINEFAGMVPNCIWGCISAKLWHTDTKFCVTLTMPH